MLWIAFSDAIVFRLDFDDSAAASMLKGIGFVIATAGALYQLLARAERRARPLEAERDMQALLANLSNDILVMEDDEQRIVAVNDRALEAYESDRLALVGRPVTDLRAPGSLETFVTDRVALTATGHALYQTQHRSLRGRTFDVEVSARRVVVDGRNYVHNSIRDLSKYWREQQWLKLFFELPFVGMAITSPESKRWIRANDELCRMLGYPRSVLERMTWAEVTHPDDLERDVREFQEVLAGRSEGYRMRKRFVRSDGELVHASIDVRCARRADGSVDLFIATIRDITEIVRSEEALARSRDLYAMLSDTNEAVLRATDESALLEAACSIAVRTGGFGLAVAHLLEEDAGLRQVAIHATPDFEQRLSYCGLGDIHAPARTVLASGELMTCNDLASRGYDATWIGVATDGGAASVAACPLSRGGRTIGAITVYARETGYFRGEILQALNQATGNLSYALDALMARRARDRATAALTDANRRLQATNMQLNSLIENSPAAVLDLDRKGRVRSIWNRAAEHITGIPASRAIGHEIPIQRGAQRDQTRFARRVLAGGTVQGEQITRQLLDGRVVHFNASGAPIRNGAGEVEAALIIVVDVTDHVHSQEALIASERTYRLLFDRHPAPMWVYDLDTRFVLAVNTSAVDAYGYTRDEFLTLRIDDLRPASEMPRLLSYLAAPRGELQHAGTWVHRRKDGGLMDVEIDSHEIEFDGRRARLVMATNVTERARAERARLESEAELKALNLELEDRIYARTTELLEAKERAEQADRVKSVFLATVSHELRTPLNSIIGFTDLLLQDLTGPLAPEQRKQIGIVNSAGRHLLALVSDFLDISKIEAGVLEIKSTSFDLLEMLDAEEPAYRMAAADRGLALQILRDGSPCFVQGDPKRVRQVIHNLVTNAIKFTERGRVSVSVEREPDAVRILVSDTGIGIAAEEMADLFEPFSQVGRAMHRGREGTGLGLAIARRLVEAMGGGIGVSSQPGRGSHFWFTLPRPAPRIEACTC